MSPNQRREVGDIGSVAAYALSRDLAKGFLHVDGVPIGDCVQGEAEGSELLFLPLECGAIDACQRRKPPEAVAKGQRLQGSIAPQKSAAETGGVAASHLLRPGIFSDLAGKPPDKRGFSPPATS